MTVIYITLNKTKDQVLGDWNKYRCHPLVVPFAGAFGKNTLKNLQGCFWVNFKAYFTVFLIPFQYMTKIITKILGGLSGEMNGFRNITKPIRLFFKKMAEKFFDITQRFTIVMAYFFTKIQSLTKRSLGTFKLMHHTLVTSQYMMKSVFDGPVGTMTKIWWKTGKFIGDFFCFAAETPIILESGNTKHISKLKLGDKLKGGNSVLGILQTSATGITMYQYKNIQVAGSHLVFENGVWQRVEEIESLKPIDFSEKFLYCLITTNNRICTPTAVFSDFIETNNIEINNKINTMVLSQLNTTIATTIAQTIKPTSETSKEHTYFWGFTENTPIDLPTGTKQISDLKIGDKISTGTVIGLVKHRFSRIQLYTYQYQQSAITVSGSQAVLEDGKWIRVYQSKYSMPSQLEPRELYHIMTDSNRLFSGGIQFTDYLESSDLKLNTTIDYLVTKYLNIQHSSTSRYNAHESLVK